MKRFLTLSLLVFCSSGMAADSSRWSSWIYKRVNKPISRVLFQAMCVNDAETSNADQEYQQLAQEAQTKFGIPLHEQLPVKNLPSLYVGNENAVVGPDAIYIHPGRMTHLSYGEKRSILFHEAAHVKNHDAIKDIYGITYRITKMAMFIGLTEVVIRSLPQHSLPIISAMSAVFLYTSMVDDSQTKISAEIETRADIEGAYTSDCHICIDERAQRFKQWEDPSKWDIPALLAQGYLSPQRLGEIRDALKSKNRLCTVHKNGHNVQ